MERDPFGFPVVRNWPAIDAAGMIEVDRLMIGHYDISLPQMMENAGRALATLASVRFLGRDPRGTHVVVLAGGGGNGGGALVAARRLAGWGARVSIVLSQDPAAMAPVPARQLAILERMGLQPGGQPDDGIDLILDGLIGYSLHGVPRGRVAELISWARAASAPVLSLDVPSGFDAASGKTLDPSMVAVATLTLAAPKIGLSTCAAAGDLYVADISVPPTLYCRLPQPLSVPPFSAGDILRIAKVSESATAPLMSQ
ncbi:NAD(P)H-hydrate epimerase [Pseudoxanthomonas japonensis]|uniref:NAD(P)H-hydrate epimerase n=1 Tax=Pseudoxanthomonas japonensis TaxID=69284 RepID=UPI00374797F4